MKERIEALIRAWPDDRGDPPDTDYQRGYMAACEEHARELAALLAADAGGWRNMDSAPRDGTPILVFRRIHGWSVYGWARWVDVRGICGWIGHGFFDPPGELGLGEPDLWCPLELPEPPPREGDAAGREW